MNALEKLSPKSVGSNLAGEEIAREVMKTQVQQKITVVQEAMLKLPQVNCPLVHRFTPGLYTREIFMPKGTLIISKIHKTEHPFIITRGKVSVWIEGVGVKVFNAPYVGITKPGTRRILYIHEDCSWLTFHATQKTTPEEVEQDVIYNPNEPEALDICQETIKELTQNESQR